jgi:hypothetical protein
MSLIRAIAGFINNTDVRSVRLDSSTHTMQTIDYEHHEVHSGSHFIYTQCDADFDIADAVELLIVTPNTTKWAHIVIDVDAALDTTVSLYEGSTHTVNAAQTAYNKNRNSATANTTTINTHNNDGADGTLIWQSCFGINTGGGSNKVAGGGESRGAREWVLDQNNKYLLTILSGSDNSSMALKLSWYEHTDKA